MNYFKIKVYLFKKRHINLIFILLSGLIPLIVGIASIRLWELNLDILPGLSGDGALGSAIIKSIIQNGWSGLYFNNMIGAPTGATLIDTPFLDNIFALFVFVLSQFTHSPSRIFYLIYLSTFFTSGMAMFFFLRRYISNNFISLVFSILFALAPTHFYRGMGHLTLSNYFTVPIGLFIVMEIYEGSISFFKKNPSYNRINNLIIFLLALILGMGQSYYAFFSLILIICAIFGNYIKQKSIDILINNSIVFIFVAVGFLSNIIPKILYGVIFGVNFSAGIRVPMEAELYGLKIIQLLLPVTYSKIQFLSEITSKYSSTFPLVTENTFSSLGFIGSVGFIFLSFWLIVSFLKKDSISSNSRKIDFVSLSVLILVLFSTIGGFGTIFNFFITPQFRTLNRVSIFITALSYFGLSLFLDRLKDRKKIILKIILISILCIGLYDQIPYFPVSGYQNDAIKIQKEYEVFFDNIEKELTNGELVYQLPFMEFPEVAPIYKLLDYSHFKGYLLTENIKWSYGNIKGRMNLSKDLLVGDNLNILFLKNLLEYGFSGLYIDTSGYLDDGLEINNFLTEKIGLTPIISNDKLLYFYNIDKIDKSIFLGLEFTSIYKDKNELTMNNTNWIIAIPILLDQNTTYRIELEIEAKNENFIIWSDFYGGETYDNALQQHEIEIFSNKNNYIFYINSGMQNTESLDTYFRIVNESDKEFNLNKIEIYEVNYEE